MVSIDFDQFDDELQTMQELVREGQITLQDDSLKVPIASLHLKKAVSIELGTSIKKCIDTMHARHFGCVLVVNKKKLCGIFTEQDVLRKIAGQDIDLESEKIDNYLTPEPVSLHIAETLATALHRMEKGGHRHVAIVDENNHPKAVLSVRDILGYVIEFFPADILNLPPHPIRVGTGNQYGG